MPVPTGARLAYCTIVAPLGAGGMGEVYRAHDDRLDRDVAVKILPESVRADPARLSGFRREARMLAALNHPNIAQIYGLEEPGSGEAPFLVLELVDGPTLADRIANGPVPVAEAIPIAIQIAAGLEAAHDAGIVHRDLKPANVKLRPDGTVKVLDFGLAKALQADPAAGGHASALATFTATGSAVGLIVGTAAYMAPEQAKGRPVDRRADVWAFGVVLYEVLTGQRLFDGNDVSEVLAAVLTREPDWSHLPVDTPAPLRRLLVRCLVKDPRARLDSMAAVRLDLTDALGAEALPASPPSFQGWRRQAIPAAIAACTVAGLLVSLWWWRPGAGTSNTETPSVTAVMADPAVVSAFIYGFALSPDVRTLVYAGRGADGVRRLWRRRLSEASAEPLAGTENAESPFWSPDSQYVGFFADGALKRVPAAGGIVRTITEARGAFPRGTWSTSDTILFSTDNVQSSGIRRVDASGGTPAQPLIEGRVSDPEWLPDNRHFLFVRHLPEPAHLMIGTSEGSGPPVEITTLEGKGGEAAARFSRAGFLVFDQGGALGIQRFDAAAGRVEGPVAVIGRRAGAPRGSFAVSVSGTTVAALNPDTADPGATPGDPITRLEWVDRQGRRLGQLGDAARFWTLTLSPDTSAVAVSVGDDIWTISAATGVSNRIMEGSGALWMPDSRHLLYRGDTELGTIPAGGGTPRRILQFTDRVDVPTSMTADGRFAALMQLVGGDAKSLDIAVLSIADGTVRPLIATDANESQAAFSPDGRFIAYVSDQTGRPEVYARKASEGPIVRVSLNGGGHPTWRGDGSELVFVSPADDMMAVDMSSFERTGRVGTPTRLFHVVMNDVVRDWFSPYAMTPDGQRFLVSIPERPEPLSWMTHVDQALSRK